MKVVRQFCISAVKDCKTIPIEGQHDEKLLNYAKTVPKVNHQWNFATIFQRFFENLNNAL